MIVQESIKATGAVNIKLHDKNGNLKDELNIPNLIVDLGKNFIASRVANNTKVPMNHMALGSGITHPVGADTQLEDELLNARIPIASPTVSSNVITFIGIFSPGYAVGSISEAGIFNSNSGAADMLCRTTFPPITKTQDDTITLSWKITIN